MATNDYLDLLEAGAPDGQLLGAIRLSTVNRVARLRVANETGLARVHILSNNGVELSSTMDKWFNSIFRRWFPQPRP